MHVHHAAAFDLDAWPRYEEPGAMSQHEIDDFVEEAVGLLATSHIPAARLRSYYASLYEWQGRFDASFTHFRNMEQLLAARFVYRIEPSEHPDFAQARGYFDQIQRFAHVRLPGTEPDGSYVKPPYLYFDAGSNLWRRLVDSGKLTGADAEPPEQVPIQLVGLDVARIAECKNNAELISRCYRLLLAGIFMDPESDDDSEAIRHDDSVLELRRIVSRTRALEHTYDYGCLTTPSAEDLAQMPLLDWWFDLDRDLN
jgi:hypothetical protein